MTLEKTYALGGQLSDEYTPLAYLFFAVGRTPHYALFAPKGTHRYPILALALLLDFSMNRYRLLLLTAFSSQDCYPNVLVPTPRTDPGLFFTTCCLTF